MGFATLYPSREATSDWDRRTSGAAWIGPRAMMSRLLNVGGGAEVPSGRRRTVSLTAREPLMVRSAKRVSNHEAPSVAFILRDARSAGSSG